MTPEEIGKMTDRELQKALARVRGWKALHDCPGFLIGFAPGQNKAIFVPSWPTDPTASAQLRQELWKRLRLYSLVIKAEPDRVTVMIRRAGDYLNPVWILERLVTDHIATECRAVAKAALIVLTEAKP